MGANQNKKISVFGGQFEPDFTGQFGPDLGGQFNSDFGGQYDWFFHISFKYKDYKTIDQDKKPVERILRLHYEKFFPRLLQHVPLRYFRLVRYYGLYSTKNVIDEQYLNKDIEQNEEQWNMDSPFVCTFCKKDRTYLYTIFDKRIREERIKALFDVNIHPSFIHKRA